MSEMPKAYKCVLRKARKTHICYECGGTIVVGEKYHMHSGIWDSAPATYKVCADCQLLRGDIVNDMDLIPSESPCFGDLSEYICETSRPIHFIKRYYKNAFRRTIDKERQKRIMLRMHESIGMNVRASR